MPIKRIFDKFKEKKEKRNRQCDEIIAQITAANKDYDAIFNNQNDYIALSAITDWEDNNSGVLEIIDKNDLKKLKKANKFKELVTLKEEVERKRSAFSDNINRYNFMIAKREVDNGYALIGDVEERKLDEQQMMCVVRKAHNHLIIAGAGTGKTTTVVGKIKYLLKSGQYEPKNILVLSFTNASASEMSERIAKETGCEIEASTFHKLGLNIIKAAENKVPKITTISLNKFIRAELDELIKKPEYLKKNQQLHILQPCCRKIGI